MNPIDITMDSIDWKPVQVVDGLESDLPHVTHEGLMVIGDASLKCYTLSDGRRIIDMDDMNRFFNGA